MMSEAHENAPGVEATPGAGDALQKQELPAADPPQKEATPRIGLIDNALQIAEVRAFANRLQQQTGATVRASSIYKLLIERQAGSYAVQVGWVRFDKDGEATASDDQFAPDEGEVAAIGRAWKLVRFPQYRPQLYTARHLPQNDKHVPWSMADPASIAVCWDAKREHILCVEERSRREDGRKLIVIWSPFEDGKWRISEPEMLPLYGLETIRDAAKIMVHEGPKAAKAVQTLIADDAACAAHPLGRELRGYREGAVAHVAWLGGAERPTATDWSPLAKSTARIVVVADNDDPGRNAVPAIARAIGREMWMIQFDARFGVGFDLADPIPDSLFTEEADGAA